MVAALGPSLQHTLIAVAIVWWPFYSRIVRGEVKALAARPHVEAARLAGVGRVRLAVRHLLPGRHPGDRGHRQPRRRQPGADPGRPVVPRSRAPGAGARARGHGRPGPAPTCSSSGGCRSCRAWPCMFLALVANLAGDGLRDLLGDRPDVRLADRASGSGAMVVVLLFLAVVVFTLQHLTPTDPVHSFLGANASKAAIAAETPQAGLRQAARRAVRPLRRRSAARQPADVAAHPPAGHHRPAPLPARHRSSWPCSAWSWPPCSAASSASPPPPASGRRALPVHHPGGASAPPFLLALLGILLFYRRPRLAAGDRADQPGQPADRTDRLPHHRHPAARQPARLHRRHRPPDPPGPVRRHPPGRVHRPGAALEPGVDHALRLRAHGPGQGAAGGGRAVAPRPAQLARPGAVDGRPAGRASCSPAWS